jgi:TIR domain
MRPGTPLIRTITEAVSDAPYVAVMLSAQALQSSWVEEELKQAMSHEFHTKQIKVIPCLLEDCEVPLFLKDRLRCDFRKDDFKGVVELLSGLYPQKHIITIKIDPENPLRLDEEQLRSDLEHKFLYSTDIQELLFIFDVHMLAELDELWKSQETQKEEALIQRSIAKLLLPNLAFALTHAANLQQEYHGKSATTVDRILAVMRSCSFLVLRDFWKCVTKSTQLDDLTAISGSLVTKKLDEAGLTASKQEVAAKAFSCHISELLDLGLQGCDDVGGLQLWVPRVEIQGDTLRCLERKQFPLLPDSEISSYKWMKYFVPGIVWDRVWMCSRSGEYLSKVAKKFSVHKKDYVHVGFS